MAKGAHELNLVKNHDLHVKVSDPQKKKIEENAQAAGFMSVSDFVRHVSIENGYTIEQRIKEIHEAIIGQKSQARQKYVALPTRTYEQNSQLALYGINPQEYAAFGPDSYL